MRLFSTLLILLIISCDSNGNRPMPFHQEIKIIIKEVKYEDGKIIQIVALPDEKSNNKIEDMNSEESNNNYLLFNVKASKAFKEYLPLKPGDLFLIRETVISDSDNRFDEAYYQVLRKL